MRPERAVDLAFDRAHGEVVVALGRHVVVGETRIHLVVGLATHHDVEADGQRAFGLHLLEAVDGGEAGAGVLERGHPLGERLLGGQHDLAAELRVHLLGRAARLRLGEGRRHGPLGRLAQQTGEFAVLVAHQLAPRRRLRVAIVPGQRQRGGVGEAGVSRRVAEQHRVVRAHRRQRCVGRVALDRRIGWGVPLLLVPAAAPDPLPRLGFGRRLGDHGHDRVPVGGVVEVEDRLAVAQAHVVPVPLDEPGHDEAAAQLDNLGLGADVGADLLVAAHRDNPAIVDGDPLGHGIVGVDGGDDAATQNQIDAFARLAADGEKDGERQRAAAGRCGPPVRVCGA